MIVFIVIYLQPEDNEESISKTLGEEEIGPLL
jgi:hypothetical protein